MGGRVSVVAGNPWLPVLPRGQRWGRSYPQQHTQPHHYALTEASLKPFPKPLSAKSKEYAHVSHLSSLSSSAAASFQKTGVINTALPGPGHHLALCFLHACCLLSVEGWGRVKQGRAKAEVP